jgi:hypothetical protein
MIACDLCTRLTGDRQCSLGLKMPSSMRCREFSPGIESFCADPKDFVNSRQLLQMATFFGIKGSELKKVKVMAERYEDARV